MLLIHLFAWPCGSIASGQRRALERMMPFSVETVSAGSPSTRHWRTTTASAITCGGVAGGGVAGGKGVAVGGKVAGGSIASASAIN